MRLLKIFSLKKIKTHLILSLFFYSPLDHGDLFVHAISTVRRGVRLNDKSDVKIRSMSAISSVIGRHLRLTPVSATERGTKMGDEKKSSVKEARDN